jgi:hypothetical protein
MSTERINLLWKKFEEGKFSEIIEELKPELESHQTIDSNELLKINNTT